ncbi:MAG: hypothetical protein ABI644_11235 [Arenimonas sp.]
MPRELHPKSKDKITGWDKKLGAFFMYPARAEVLPAVAILTVCTIVSGYLSVVGLVIALATTLTAYKFAFEILQHHADGWEEPPEAMMTISGGLVFQYIFVLLVAAIIYWTVKSFLGVTAALVVLALFSLIQPAYTMLTVIEGSALWALNPPKWLRLMQILGNGYFLLALLLFVGQLFEIWLGNHVFSFMPDIIATAIVKIIGLWILFASAYWMGYLIYQYHRDLDYVPNAHNDQAVRAMDRDGMLIQALDTAIANESYEECITRVKYESRERVLSIAAQSKYRELLVKKGDPAEIRQHAQTFLHQLLTEKNLPRAMSLAIQQFGIDPGFVPLDGETTDVLVKEARRIGQASLEKKLLVCLLQNFPNEAVTGDWAIRLSEILIQAGEPNTEAVSLLDAASATTRSETQRQRLIVARQAIAVS